MQSVDRSCIVPSWVWTYKSRSTTRLLHPTGVYFIFPFSRNNRVKRKLKWCKFKTERQTRQMTSGKCIQTFTSSSSACGSSMPSGTHFFVSGRDSSFSTKALSPFSSNSVKWVHLPECSVPGEPDGVLGQSEGRDFKLSSESLAADLKVW